MLIYFFFNLTNDFLSEHNHYCRFYYASIVDLIIKSDYSPETTQIGDVVIRIHNVSTPNLRVC